MSDVVVVTSSEDETDNDQHTETIVEEVTDAVVAAVEATKEDDGPHVCDESCPCRQETRDVMEATAAAGLVAAEALRLAEEAHAVAVGTARHLAAEYDAVEEMAEPEVTGVESIPTEDSTERKCNLLW